MSQDAALTLEESPSTIRTALVAFVAMLVGHTVVDLLAELMPSSLVLLEVRVGMTPEQSAWLMGLGPLVSGLSQPICAVISDRYRSRLFGVLGLLLVSVGICSLGLAPNMATLVPIYLVAIAGAGMFHPIAAATVGFVQQHRRTRAVGLFFFAGMLGGLLGAIFWPRFLCTEFGFDVLPYLMIPALVLVAITQWSFQRLPMPRSVGDVAVAEPIPISNWRVVGILYVTACIRFCVNTALFYLYLRWAQSHAVMLSPMWSVEEVAKWAAPVAGNLQASTFFGMAIGGLLAGQLIGVGREKRPLVVIPICLAPTIAAFPFVSLELGYLFSALAGMGFASMIPINIALAQRLLPHRTNLASSLMMGGAWSVSFVGPPLAQWCISLFGIDVAFFGTAGMLAISGLCCVLVKNAVVGKPATYIL